MLRDNPELLAYVNAWLNPAHSRPGGFLEAFLKACSRADPHNFSLIYPALLVIKEKYPAQPDVLRIELHEITGLDYDENGAVVHRFVTPIAIDAKTREILTPERIEAEGYKPLGS